MVRLPADTDVFQAISCPTRRRLLALLAERQRPVHELVEALSIRQPSVSEQLRVLRETGLVDVEHQGRSRLYRFQPAGLQPLVDWMAEFSRFWDVKLDALASFLKEHEKE